MKLLCLVFLLLQSITVKSIELTKRDWASVLWSEIESTTTCTGCGVLVDLLKVVAGLGDDFFVSTLTELCIISKAENPDVCEGAFGLEGPILASSLRGMEVPSHTSQLFCITFFGLCSYPDITTYKVPFPSPKPNISRPISTGQSPITIVQFSDIHVDPFYETGASYNCTMPLCCRPFTFEDSPGQNEFPAGPFGNTNCDAPKSLEESMYAAIKQIAPNASLTLFTGDIVDHFIWSTNKTQNIEDINDAYSRMSGLPRVYGTAGNHESSPTNSFPPAALTLAATEYQWVYDTLSSNWTQWIGAKAAREVERIGAYSVLHPGSNLRVISLNTNFYYTLNYWLYEKNMETDPSGQLAWFVNELQIAETVGERVYIIGHMPMGLPDALRDPSNYFDQIVNRYSATIAALFFGHTHADEFQITYSDYTARSFDNAQQVSYICPSMTPTSGNPAFRVYSVDPITFGILDSTTYIANISLPTYQTSGPIWEKYYSAKETYGPLVPPSSTTIELTPAFWHNVTTALDAQDSAFQAYYSRKSRGYSTATCTGACKAQEICQLRAARAEDNCATITPGLGFGKRSDLERAVEIETKMGECDGSLLRPILAKLVARKGSLEDVTEKVENEVRCLTRSPDRWS